MSFNKLGLDNWLLKNISCLAYKHPTPVQEKIIPQIINEKSIIAISKTGTGKTASFCLPLLNILSSDPFGLFAIILEPTRELAIQVLEKLKIYSTGFNLRVSLIYGGTDYTQQLVELARIPHIIIATPGRLKTLLENGSIQLVRNLKFLVLDEFDQLLNDSICPDIEEIVKMLPESRKTLFFSATMGKDKNFLNKLRGKEDQEEELYEFNFNKLTTNKPNNDDKDNNEDGNNDDNSNDGNNENDNNEIEPLSQMNKELDQKFILLNQKMKEHYIVYLLRGTTYKNKTTLVFVSTHRQCNFLYQLLKLFDLRVSCLHSKLRQSERIKNLTKFKSSVSNILISTDLASRGLDIPIVDLVINFDLPRDPDDYIHRAGRTARAGNKGECISFVSQFDVELILAIEKRIGQSIEEMNVNDEAIEEDLSIVSQGIKIAMGMCEERTERVNNKNNKKYKKNK